MPGFSVHSLLQGDHLRIVIPGSAWTLLFCVPAFLLGFFVWRQTRTPRGHRAGVIWMLLVVALLGIGYTPATLDLDGQSGKVRVMTTTLLVPHWRTLPLADLSNARLAQADLSTAVVLTTRDGRAYQLTPYDQLPGTEQGVNAINAFLSAHGAFRPF